MKVESTGNKLRIGRRVVTCDYPIAMERWDKKRNQAIVRFRHVDCDVPDRFRNIVAIAPDGSTNWQVELPEGSGKDCYTLFELHDDVVRGLSYNGHIVYISAATGKILRDAGKP